MQSQTHRSERFQPGQLLPKDAPTTRVPGSLDAGPGAKGPPRGHGASTEFIITPETFQPVSGGASDQARCEIVLKLYETCYPRVYRFLRRSVSADVADDLAQETFLRLLSHKKIERMSISISYLFRIAQNLVRRRYNDLNRRRTFLNDGLKHVYSAANDDGRQRTQDVIEFDSGRMEEAIDQLSPRERDVLRLIVCRGLSYSAAARAMGVPVSTVNNWKHRALSRLREFITTGHGAEHDVSKQARREGRTERRADSSRGPGKQAPGAGISRERTDIPVDTQADGMGFESRAAG